MTKKLFALPLAVIFSCLFCPSLKGQDSSNNFQTFDESYERLTRALAKNFDQTANLIHALPNPARESADWKTFRIIKTKFWLELLNEIDNARDTKFDFNSSNNLYSANVAVPGVGMAGCAPSDIKDPITRKAYEEAIKVNHEKYLRFNLEHRLKKTATDYDFFVTGYLKSAYEKTPADAKELADYLNMVTDAVHNAELKAALHDWLKPLEQAKPQKN